MNRTTTQRFAAAFASIAVTFSLVSGVAGLAKPAGADSLFAQGGKVVVAMR